MDENHYSENVINKNTINENTINENTINKNVISKDTINTNVINEDVAAPDSTLKINDEVDKLNKHPYRALDKEFRKHDTFIPSDIYCFAQKVCETLKKIKVETDNEEDRNREDYIAFKKNLANCSAGFRIQLLDIAANLIENNYIEKADPILSLYYMTTDGTYKERKKSNDYLATARELSAECVKMEKCLDMLAEKKKTIDSDYSGRKKSTNVLHFGVKDINKGKKGAKAEFTNPKYFKLSEAKAKFREAKALMEIYDRDLRKAFDSFDRHYGRINQTGNRQNPQNYYGNMKEYLDSLGQHVTVSKGKVNVTNLIYLDNTICAANQYIRYAERKSFWYKLPGSTGRKRYNEAKAISKALQKISDICSKDEYKKAKRDVEHLEKSIDKANQNLSNSKESISHSDMDKRYNMLNSQLYIRSNKLEAAVQLLSGKDKKEIKQIAADKKKVITAQHKKYMQL